MLKLLTRAVAGWSKQVRSPGRRAEGRRGQLRLEVLEKRDLMACGISFAGGVVTVEGTNVNDRADVQPWGAGIMVRLDCGNNGVIDHAAVFGPGIVNQIVFRGLDGNDYFHNNTPLPSIAYGGDGNDDLHGGSGTDKLFGEDGHDCLCGGAGDDWLYGGAGNDLMHGRGGNDQMWGGDGDDLLYGEDGNDFLSGDAGNDRLQGLAGNDVLRGGLGSDWMYGGAGLDFDDLGPIDPMDVVRDPNGDGPPVIEC